MIMMSNFTLSGRWLFIVFLLFCFLQGGPGQAGRPGPPGPQGAAVSDPSVSVCLKIVQQYYMQIDPSVLACCHSDHVEGSICSPPCFNKAKTQTEKTSMRQPVKFVMFCFLGAHPG